MLKQIFYDIWKNPVSRYGFVFLVSIMVLALILKAHMSIYTFVYNITAGDTFDDPHSYYGKSYNFEEEPDRANKLYRNTIEDIVEYSADLYKLEEPEKIFIEQWRPEDHWQSTLTPEARKLVNWLLSDLKLFCLPFEESISISSRIRQEERLKKRKLIKREKEGDILVYAVKDENYQKIANMLLEQESLSLRLALQKKPDHIPARRMQFDIYKASCRHDLITHRLRKTLSYLEYKTEKEIYNQLLETEYKDANELSRLSFEKLKINRLYLALLNEYFHEAYYTTKDLHFRARQAWNIYMLDQDPDHLMKYVEARLELARVSGRIASAKIYENLLSVSHRTIEFNPEYIYALAEVAYRAGKKKESYEHLSRIIGNERHMKSTIYPEARRLWFLLDLES